MLTHLGSEPSIVVTGHVISDMELGKGKKKRTEVNPRWSLHNPLTGKDIEVPCPYDVSLTANARRVAEAFGVPSNTSVYLLKDSIHPESLADVIGAVPQGDSYRISLLGVGEKGEVFNR